MFTYVWCICKYSFWSKLLMLRILHHLDVQIYLANETVYTIELVSYIFHRHQHKWMVQFQKGRRVGSLKKWDDDESN